MIYVFDTSALITLFRPEVYDRRVFPTLWENFDALVQAEQIVSVREARREIRRIDVDLLKWAQDNSKLFFAPDGSQTQFVKELFDNEHWQGLVKHRSIVAGTPVADPFVIALAYHIDGYVVTQEKDKPNAPCIPGVCRKYSVKCTNLVGFMDNEGWRF